MSADDLAYVHHTGFADLARAAAPFVVGELARRGLRRATVVDLGCGSGHVLAALGRAGHRAMGVDLSASMLALARERAPQAHLVRGSLHRVPLPSAHAVLALGEPLGSLPSRGPPPRLDAFFARVARRLHPDGFFLFDVIVDRPGPALAGRNHRTGPDWAVLAETEEDAARTRLVRHITSFVARDGCYRRAQERHHVRVFNTRDLVQALRVAGFRCRVLTSYGAMPLAVRRRAFLCSLAR